MKLLRKLITLFLLGTNFCATLSSFDLLYEIENIDPATIRPEVNEYLAIVISRPTLLFEDGDIPSDKINIPYAEIMKILLIESDRSLFDQLAALGKEYSDLQESSTQNESAINSFKQKLLSMHNQLLQTFPQLKPWFDKLSKNLDRMIREAYPELHFKHPLDVQCRNNIQNQTNVNKQEQHAKTQVLSKLDVPQQIIPTISAQIIEDPNIISIEEKKEENNNQKNIITPKRVIPSDWAATEGSNLLTTLWHGVSGMLSNNVAAMTIIAAVGITFHQVKSILEKPEKTLRDAKHMRFERKKEQVIKEFDESKADINARLTDISAQLKRQEQSLKREEKLQSKLSQEITRCEDEQQQLINQLTLMKERLDSLPPQLHFLLEDPKIQEYQSALNATLAIQE